MLPVTAPAVFTSLQTPQVEGQTRQLPIQQSSLAALGGAGCQERSNQSPGCEGPLCTPASGGEPEDYHWRPPRKTSASQARSLFPHSVRKRPHHIPTREGERSRSGLRKRVSKEGDRGLPEQPEVGWGQEENTEDSCPAVGFFPEFDFLIEVLPNFNSEKKKEREREKKK